MLAAKLFILLFLTFLADAQYRRPPQRPLPGRNIARPNPLNVIGIDTVSIAPTETPEIEKEEFFDEPVIPEIAPIVPIEGNRRPPSPRPQPPNRQPFRPNRPISTGPRPGPVTVGPISDDKIPEDRDDATISPEIVIVYPEENSPSEPLYPLPPRYPNIEDYFPFPIIPNPQPSTDAVDEYNPTDSEPEIQPDAESDPEFDTEAELPVYEPEVDPQSDPEPELQPEREQELESEIEKEEVFDEPTNNTEPAPFAPIGENRIPPPPRPQPPNRAPLRPNRPISPRPRPSPVSVEPVLDDREETTNSPAVVIVYPDENSPSEPLYTLPPRYPIIEGYFPDPIYPYPQPNLEVDDEYIPIASEPEVQPEKELEPEPERESELPFYEPEGDLLPDTEFEPQPEPEKEPESQPEPELETESEQNPALPNNLPDVTPAHSVDPIFTTHYPIIDMGGYEPPEGEDVHESDLNPLPTPEVPGVYPLPPLEVFPLPRPSPRPILPPRPFPTWRPFPTTRTTPTPRTNPTSRTTFTPRTIPTPRPTPPPTPKPETIPPITSENEILTPKPVTPNRSTPAPTKPYAPVVSRPIPNFNCEYPDVYYSIANECDTFIQCRKSVARKYVCPDGLLFNPKAYWPDYPCVYPSQVRCSNKTIIQKPRPTSECPRQFGNFPSRTGDCGKYVVCHDGRATLMTCPYGLAFNIRSGSCDWPENVPSCNPNVFQGFTCPPAARDQYGRLSNEVYNFKYRESCKEYIACLRGEPRLLRCDAGLSFDSVSGRCIDSDAVFNCKGDEM